MRERTYVTEAGRTISVSVDQKIINETCKGYNLIFSEGSLTKELKEGANVSHVIFGEGEFVGVAPGSGIPGNRLWFLPVGGRGIISPHSNLPFYIL